MLVSGAYAVRVDDAMGEDYRDSSGKMVELGTQQEKCCCRGPDPRLCRMLSGAQLGKTFFTGELTCPAEHGYHRVNHPENGGDEGAAERLEECEKRIERKATRITVTAYWMRHGFSCANAFNQLCASPTRQSFVGLLACGAAKIHQIGYQDPPLTKYAVKEAEKLGEWVRNAILRHRQKMKDDPGAAAMVFERVFSSVMLRAMETALWNFPRSIVRPTPFCSETGRTYDNIPNSWEQQKALWGTLGNDDLVGRIEFLDVKRPDHPLRSTIGEKDNYDHFSSYFASVLDLILREETEADNDQILQKADGSATDIPVIIVSHSGYMKHNLECGKSTEEGGYGRKPHNNEVWVQKYSLDLGAWDAKLQPLNLPGRSMSCIPLEDLVQSDTLIKAARKQELFSRSPEYLCPDEVERCSSAPEAWLEYSETEHKCSAARSVIEGANDKAEGGLE